MNLKIVAVLVAIFMLGGCVSFQPSTPEGYAGPSASIQDSATVQSGSKVDLFFVSSVDDRILRNSQIATRIKNDGRGFSVTPVTLTHTVPARLTKFKIIGITHLAAPILYMNNYVYTVEGVVEFTPEEKKNYVVKGVLDAESSTVWVEEVGTGRMMGPKIEAKGKKPEPPTSKELFGG